MTGFSLGCHLLLYDSESSQHVVDAVNNQHIVPLLFVLLKSHATSSQIVKSVGMSCVNNWREKVS